MAPPYLVAGVAPLHQDGDERDDGLRQCGPHRCQHAPYGPSPRFSLRPNHSTPLQKSSHPARMTQGRQ